MSRELFDISTKLWYFDRALKIENKGILGKMIDVTRVPDFDAGKRDVNQAGAATLNEDFIRAVKGNDIVAVQKYTQQGADINRSFINAEGFYDFDYNDYYQDVEYASPLFYAFKKDKQDMAEILLANNADVNKTTKDGETVLALAGSDMQKNRQIVEARGFDASLKAHRKALNTMAEKKDKDAAHKAAYLYLRTVFTEKWQKIDNETVSRTQFDKDGMVEITDHFNFKSAERTRYVRDFELDASHMQSCFFADMPQNARQAVKEAWEELKKRGGGQGIDARLALNEMRHYSRRAAQKGMVG